MTELRYWTALTSSLIFALFAFGGFGMGGPRDVFGWGIVIAIFGMPILLWWTRIYPVGRMIQWAWLGLVGIFLALMTVVAVPST
ncbi:hypothetical protein [Sphingomicrobium astaxanthinifaciens]|uniref:hypothetical protein n=1 Tax=Sphingomicrobium astaxanthinifaciens TaxID=1227949 RepID=UPI001FCAD970|nr:hypothetical protein [Sphingomicrobium astaxanthinifaciens]MCJ7421240.1 hypothetical protein [Sphingomicrobium astaxanthinifaciens]